MGLTDDQKEFAHFTTKEGDTVKVNGLRHKVVKKCNGQLILEPIEVPWYYMLFDTKNKLHKIFIDNFKQYLDTEFKRHGAR